MDYTIARRAPSDKIPYHLLLLADEHQPLIDAYLPFSQIYLLSVAQQVEGIYLLRTDGLSGEIVNIAVAPAYQGRGLGKALLKHAIAVANEQGLHRLVIKTGNSGLRQICLYQQQGFNLIDVVYNYFLAAYPHPIWENKIQCKHQLIFELLL